MFYRNRHRFIFMLAFSALGFTACARSSATDSSSRNSSKTFIVKRGNFSQTLRLSGVVGAVESFSVLAPRLYGPMMGSGSMVITKIAHNGETVRKGDVLVEFDRQTQLKNIMDRQADYDGYLQQIRKKQADQISAKVTDETEIKGAEVDVQSSLVEMRKNDLVPRYQADTNKSNLDEAQAQLKQLKETFNLKRQAERADIRILEIQRDRALKALEYAKSNVDRMTVSSTMDGLVVLTPIYRGNVRMEPKEGDEIRSGSVIMQVVNPSAMKVTASVNQADIAQVHIGQSGDIRLDAYPDLVLPGRVERINLISSSDADSKRIRFFSVMFSIQGRNPKLLPDLSASVDVQVQTLNKVLIVPREAIIDQNQQPFVEVSTKGKTEKRTVKIGAMNDCEAVIDSGLQEGMVISLNPQT
jgi:HlyD family secretion protein